jgi:phospholipid/cholesterol/gamma-HCH transport system permease protein
VTGAWTLAGLGDLPQRLAAPAAAGSGSTATATPPPAGVAIGGHELAALDSAGAWVLIRWLRTTAAGSAAAPRVWPGWPAMPLRLIEQVAATPVRALPQPQRAGRLQGIGRGALAAARQGRGFVAFVGEAALAGAGVMRHPQRLRWRMVLREVQIGGVGALPIVGLTAFLLGVVVAYQGADQLRHYGANLFVVDLVGYAMLREFAPLISAIIIAGRSGSAYAAQIGTMVVAEEVDAMRTLAISPQEQLVLPKLLALALALPLLTVFADVAGVFGGMVMARTQLDIGFHEFADRFGRVMPGSAFLIGVGKAWVFALIIVLVGCFQGFRTQGSADSVGRQTTLAVVQAIFLVIVADALFSVAFNALHI